MFFGQEAPKNTTILSNWQQKVFYRAKAEIFHSIFYRINYDRIKTATTYYVYCIQIETSLPNAMEWILNFISSNHKFHLRWTWMWIYWLMCSVTLCNMKWLSITLCRYITLTLMLAGWVFENISQISVYYGHRNDTLYVWQVSILYLLTIFDVKLNKFPSNMHINFSYFK